jgi:8-oxo-dGTP pyrophosphatase MutT (NUDIX family)
MTEIEIVEALTAAPAGPTQPLDGLVRASVLIPFYQDDEGWQLLFTRRTEHLLNHKGQVAFPGGAADRIDQSPEDTALRETNEEIGISSQFVRILGRIEAIPTNTNFLVTPVVGVIAWPTPIKIHEVEVSRVFSVPLSWLADPLNREIRLYERKNGVYENVVFFHPYDGETIWGVTGKIMVNLLDLLIKRAA